MPPLIPQKDGASVRINWRAISACHRKRRSMPLTTTGPDRPRLQETTVFAAWVKIEAPGRALKPKDKDTVMVIFFLPLVGTLFGLALAFRPS